METTRDNSRKLFLINNLSYNDIGSKEIGLLRKRISRKLVEHSTSSFKMELIDGEPFKFNNDGVLIRGSIRVKGNHFDDREGITFNTDGFIGFSGWADSKNKLPFLNAFNEWTMWLITQKDLNLEK